MTYAMIANNLLFISVYLLSEHFTQQDSCTIRASV